MGASQHKMEMRKVREELKLLLLMASLVLAYGTIGYSLTLGVSLEDGVARTLETLAFEHENEDAAAPRFVQITLLLVGITLAWFIGWTLLDLVLNGKLTDYLKEVKSMIQAKALKNHYIICGAGRMGLQIAELLSEKKIPFVVIESDKAASERVARHGFLLIEGDALDETILEDANAREAKALIAAISQTEKNVLLTLVAKQINKDIIVYARAEHETMVKPLHAAGARHVVLPEVIGAREIVGCINRDEEGANAEKAVKPTESTQVKKA
ncbi:TPA: hypothetical protein HA318_01020 [Candidatus Micrarchaeota archaeon]|nr:hypothetical protein [Candidatus Micrarchaeota archaeon]